MKVKKNLAILSVLAMSVVMAMICFADPTTDFHQGPLPGETEENNATGPVVEEYMVYKDDRVVTPGSLTDEVDRNTI